MKGDVFVALVATTMALVPIGAVLLERGRLVWLVLAALASVAWLAGSAFYFYVYFELGHRDTTWLVVWSATLFVGILSAVVRGAKLAGRAERDE